LPLYYFDLRNRDKVSLDEEGLELSTLDEAEQEALHAVADMARDAIRRNPDGAEYLMAIEVRDESGPVLEVKFHLTVDRPK